MNQIIDERRMNWLWIDNEVVDRFGPQIGAYGLAVYAVLARFADNRTRVAFPAIPTIAALLKLGRTTVVAAIKSLECTEPPLITVTFGGGRTANTYTLNDLSPQMSDKDLPPHPGNRRHTNEARTPRHPEGTPPPRRAPPRHNGGTPSPHGGHPHARRRAAPRHTNGTPSPHEGHPLATRTRTILI
ncbi:helix-turn-helix domain-containing protein [Candidatus Amarolinea dominans]|uniref:helix-turn-helix domain-containing protein n=1 Tax=Candidatus Amarolinea dominans TaxID=3140696 RepID=UPI003134C8E8|nr:helix-turn-helix domain-containing protein [Anaerolineae bacterium]